MLSLRNFVRGVLALVLCAAFYASAASSVAAQQQPYGIRDVGTLTTSTSNTSAGNGINSTGNVVGVSDAFGSLDISGSRAIVYNFGSGTLSDLLGTSFLGAQNSQAFEINDGGQVTGYFASQFGGNRAFLFSNGTMTDLGTLGGYSSAQSRGLGINSSGQVVGNTNTPNFQSHAFLYSNGVMQDLGCFGVSQFGSCASVANAINNAGVAVGNTTAPSSSQFLPFVYSNGSMQLLGLLAGHNTGEANDINSNGVVAGSSGNPFIDSRAVIWNGGVAQDLGLPAGFARAQAAAINDLGQVVGKVLDSFGGSHAFLYSNGVIVDLNSLLPANSGWVLSEARDINANGIITGKGFINGQIHGFVMGPGVGQPGPPTPANPHEIIVALHGMVQESVANQGIANSLDVKLDHADKALDADRATACNDMKSFINEVNAQSGKAMTEAQADKLLAKAEQVRGLLGCR